jgi:hypothetical protein
MKAYRIRIDCDCFKDVTGGFSFPRLHFVNRGYAGFEKMYLLLAKKRAGDKKAGWNIRVIWPFFDRA